MKTDIPIIADTTIDIVSDAVVGGPECKGFDVVRKVATLATLLCEETISPEQAATSADAAVFEKHVAHKVGKGEMDEADGAELIADRESSAFVSTCREFLAEVVESGCEAAGIWIGTHLGSPTTGYAIGSAIGHFLNKPVKEIADKGARKIADYARRAWQWAKSAVKTVFDTVVNWICS